MFPKETLETFKQFLKKDGHFILSIPNVTHGSIKSNLLIDNWDYTDSGLLDITHLKFFTHKTIAKMLAELSIVVENVEITLMEPFGYQPNNAYVFLPKTLRNFILNDIHSHIGQYVIKCKIGDGTDVNISKLNIDPKKYKKTMGKMKKTVNKRACKYKLYSMLKCITFGKTREKLIDKINKIINREF